MSILNCAVFFLLSVCVGVLLPLIVGGGFCLTVKVSSCVFVIACDFKSLTENSCAS